MKSLCVIVLLVITYIMCRHNKRRRITGGSSESEPYNILYTLKTLEDHMNIIKNPKNKDKKILVVYHAPWCGHCTRFMPTLNDLAENNEDKNIIIAEIVADKIPELKIKMFPTMKLWKDGQSEVVEVDRTYDKLTSYLKDKA